MRQTSSSMSSMSSSRPLVSRAAVTALCCLIVVSVSISSVNGFVMMPSLFRSSFLSGWSSPFKSGPQQQRSTAAGANNNLMSSSSSSRRRTLAERSAFMGVDDEQNNLNSNNKINSSSSNINNLNNSEAMKSFDDTVDENMELLKYRIARNRALGPGMQPNQAPPKDVHIILFYPESEHEGVHTIEFPKGSGHNVILGFEDLKECVEFSNLLAKEEENLFVEPAPRQIHLQSLEAYCATTLGGDVQVQVVPRGTQLVPPTGTVEELNHNPVVPEIVEKKQNEKKASDLERLFELEAVVAESSTSPSKEASVGAWE